MSEIYTFNFMNNFKEMMVLEETLKGTIAYWGMNAMFMLYKHRPAYIFYTSDKKSNVMTGYILCWQIDAHTCHIAKLVVHPKYRRNGLARALLRHAIRNIPPSNTSITLFVSTANDAAIPLYVSEHFEMESIIPKYYIDGTSAFKMRRIST